MELHPYLQQVPWVEWHKRQGINVTAYSPLANTNPTYRGHPGKDDLGPLLHNPAIVEIGEERGCTAAQVVLAWGIGRKTSVIPKSSHADHISENFATLNCKLEEDDFKTIEELGKITVKRYNNPSQEYGVKLFQGLDDA